MSTKKITQDETTEDMNLAREVAVHADQLHESVLDFFSRACRDWKVAKKDYDILCANGEADDQDLLGLGMVARKLVASIERTRERMTSVRYLYLLSERLSLSRHDDNDDGGRQVAEDMGVSGGR